MRLFQLVSAISPGDAVSNDIRAIDRLMKARGVESGIYAITIDPRLPEGTASPFAGMPEPRKEDLILYHMAVCSDISREIRKYRCRKIMVWHNITPPSFFIPYSDIPAKATEAGLAEMAELRDAFDGCLADSSFNRDQLLEAGYTCPILVRPILIPFEDYRREPDADTVRAMSDGKANLLFVGRIAPNKRQEDVIRAYDCYRKNYRADARLILVGSDRGMEKYSRRLRRYIGENWIPEVIFPGHIRFDQILAYYRTADAFLCMSAHEGFCVPIAEAMSFDLPIVARGACAVPETLGGAGIVLDSAEPEIAATALNRVLTDETLRAALAAERKRRLEELSYERVGATLIRELNELTGGAVG